MNEKENINTKTLLNHAKEGWREALDLASYRQAMIDSKTRDMELLNQKCLESEKSSRIIIDEINLITLQLAHEVTSRQALNENTNYTNITSSSSSSLLLSKVCINDSLGIILERLKTIYGMIGTQDLLLNKSRDDVKKIHTLFVAEKRERAKKKEEERIKMEKEEIESRDAFEASLLQQHHNFHKSCIESITEEASVLTEDTNSVTRKKVKKKVVKK
jgi:hypothetical protein